MTLIYIIPIIIIILCLVSIIFIVGKKYHQLMLVDADTIPEEKNRKIKNKIIVDRIKRKTSAEIEKLESEIKPFWKKIRGYFESIYNKILELEKKYQEKERINKPLNQDAKEKIRELHNIAKEYLDNDDLNNAEHKYIEIISLDHKNVEAYKYLAEIYFRQKDYAHAKEILMHSLRINKKDEEIYHKLGDLYREEGILEEAKKNYIKMVTLNSRKTSNYVDLYEVYREMNEYHHALRTIQKAIILEPNNPKYLDLLAEINIILKDKQGALYAHEKLKGINPENNKLDEIKRKIDEME